MYTGDGTDHIGMPHSAKTQPRKLTKLAEENARAGFAESSLMAGRNGRNDGTDHFGMQHSPRTRSLNCLNPRKSMQGPGLLREG